MSESDQDTLNMINSFPNDAPSDPFLGSTEGWNPEYSQTNHRMLGVKGDEPIGPYFTGEDAQFCPPTDQPLYAQMQPFDSNGESPYSYEQFTPGSGYFTPGQQWHYDQLMSQPSDGMMATPPISAEETADEEELDEEEEEEYVAPTTRGRGRQGGRKATAPKATIGAPKSTRSYKFKTKEEKSKPKYKSSRKANYESVLNFREREKEAIINAHQRAFLLEAIIQRNGIDVNPLEFGLPADFGSVPYRPNSRHLTGMGVSETLARRLFN